MKSINITFALFFSVILTFSQEKNLNYVESSAGLSDPQWEGGMTELEFTDINDDGNIDIISIGDHGSPFINASEHGIMVWFGDGTGSWSVQMNGDFGYGGIAIGDVNNDGFKDAGYGMHHNYSSGDLGDQILEVALGDGSGINWIPWDDGLAANGEDWGMFGCDFADFDNDGDLDIGSISFGCCAGIHLYRNNLDGTWTQTFGMLNGNSDLRFVFGDINNDGFVDFTSSYQYGAVYFGDGQGNFVNKTLNLPSPGLLGYGGPALGDVNNDGGKEISFSTGGGVQIWRYDTVQELWVNISGNLPLSGDFQETQLYDMNVDGFTDVCAYGDGTFQLWLGDGGSTWTPDAQFTTTGISDCKAFRAGGDVDHNGFPDITLVAEGGSWPSYQNHLRCYREASTADTLKIRGLSPRGNQVFYQQSIQFIDWITEVPGGSGSTVNLYISSTGPDGPFEIIASSLPDNGRYQWTVPFVYSNECYLRFEALKPLTETASDTTGPFTVTGIPVVSALFEAVPLFGLEPLTVQFTDMSAGNPSEFAWDFENDGIYDSDLPNPQFIYSFGNYSVKLKVGNGLMSDSLIKYDYISVEPVQAEETTQPSSGLYVIPNPLSGKAVIHLRITGEKLISLKLWSLTGEDVMDFTNLVNRYSSEDQIRWTGKNCNGKRLKPGMYILELVTDRQVRAIRLLVR